MRDPSRGLSTDDRGVSVTVNYILGLSIAFLLVIGLLLTAGDFVTDQRETSIRTEMEVLGEQIATDITMADRMALTTTDNDTVSVRRSLPDRVSGTGYTIAVEGDDDPYLVLISHDPEIRVRAEFTNRTDIEMTRIQGGSIRVTDTDSGLEVERGDR
jgi:hypothetical protein